MTAKQRAEEYLNLAEKYDDAIRTGRTYYAGGVCVDLWKIDKEETWTEWYLFINKEQPNYPWWREFSPERVLALLFAHQIALHP